MNKNINVAMLIGTIVLIGSTISSIFMIGDGYQAGTYPWFYPILTFFGIFIPLVMGFGAGRHARKEEEEKKKEEKEDDD